MKNRVMKSLAVSAIIFCFALSALAQGENSKSATPASSGSPATTITAASTPIELAHAALAAQGGEKFKNLKSLVLIGSVNLYAPNSTQSVPGQFAMVVAGERFRMDVNAPPVISFKQVYDGHNSYNSLPNVPPLPSPSTFGLPLLLKVDQPGYTVTAVPDKKKQRGFKVTDPDGNSTDFYIDATTAQVLNYTTQRNGVTFAVEAKKFKEVEGVLVAYNFSWRLEMTQGAAFAEYTVKDVKLNQPVSDDVFAAPN